MFIDMGFNCGDGRVVKASDSKSDGVTRTGSNPVRREFFFLTLYYNFLNKFYALKRKESYLCSHKQYTRRTEYGAIVTKARCLVKRV
jgi:hypothetical protein